MKVSELHADRGGLEDDRAVVELQRRNAPERAAGEMLAGGVAEYYCIYRTALIAYGASEISTP